jgi:membrane protease YdiL (CAAX protease family)
MNETKLNVIRIVRVIIVVLVAFTIPIMQWITKRVFGASGYDAIIVDLLIITFCFFYLYTHKEVITIFPVNNSKKAIIIAMLIGIILLIFINIINRPISGITGQARSPIEVVELIVFGPITEEILFRGVIWSIIDKLITKSKGEWITLLGTSILFGVSHLGYWAQSSWPLPTFAFIHAVSMIIAGMIFGYLRMKANSLNLPISVHSLANGFILLFQ